MQRYAITERGAYPGDDARRLEALVAQGERLALQRVDFVQLREKDLAPQQFEDLARDVAAAIRRGGWRTRLLINSRVAVAARVGADGVHLPSGLAGAAIAAGVAGVFDAFASARLPQPYVSVSCHTLAEVALARQAAASAILFGPVFGKWDRGVQVVPGVGLEALREACELAGPVAVFALGGVTAGNAESCVRAGAAGIAGIRMFLPGESGAGAGLHGGGENRVG